MMASPSFTKSPSLNFHALTMPATEELSVTSQMGSVMPAAMIGSAGRRAGTSKHKDSRVTRLDFVFINLDCVTTNHNVNLQRDQRGAFIQNFSTSIFLRVASRS